MNVQKALILDRTYTQIVGGRVKRLRAEEVDLLEVSKEKKIASP